MPRFLLSKHIVKVLVRFGFYFVSQNGSHAKYRKDGLTVIVPIHNKEMPLGTFNSIVRQSNLNKENFTDFK
jgi:predicted RNA binding protein YcfA (HicA-like mRNA interferase family)